MAGRAALAGLPPRQARLCLAVEAFARSLAPEVFGRPLVLALSGGLDSTALLLILHALSPRMGTTLIAAHVDHCLRDGSMADAQACAALCDTLGIELAACRRDVAALARRWGTGIEDAGRRARHHWLDEVRQERGAAAVAMAHHLDDLAEDQLMRLSRGAGWPALGGMPAWDPGRGILRPLLLTPKADLAALLEATGTPWREDESNSDQAYTRNRFRRDVLPLLSRENPDYLRAAAELWRQARIDAAHWDARVEEVMGPRAAGQGQEPDMPTDPYEKAPGPAPAPCTETPLRPREVFLPRDVLDEASAALRLRLYKRAVESLGPGQPLAAALHGLDAAWLRRASGRRLQFPGNKQAVVGRGGITFGLCQTASGVDTFPTEG